MSDETTAPEATAPAVPQAGPESTPFLVGVPLPADLLQTDPTILVDSVLGSGHRTIDRSADQHQRDA